MAWVHISIPDKLFNISVSINSPIGVVTYVTSVPYKQYKNNGENDVEGIILLFVETLKLCSWVDLLILFLDKQAIVQGSYLIHLNMQMLRFQKDKCNADPAPEKLTG